MFSKQAITKKLNVPAEKVWDAISKIDRLNIWFPIIETCKVEGEGVGAMRFMSIVNGGGCIEDRIEEINHEAMTLVYLRPVSPFPVTFYKGTVEVFKSYDGFGVVVWTIDFESKVEDSAAVSEIVFNAIRDGIDGLESDLLE